MAGKTEFPSRLKVDTNGKEVIYWNALTTCGHITIYEIQCFKGDFIFCRRCNDFREVSIAKYSRITPFIAKHGGELVA